MNQTIHIHYPEFSHPDFKRGSVGGALVMLFKDVRPDTITKIDAFIDHKGNKRPWYQVRNVLFSHKVRKAMPVQFRTEMTPEGMTFYALAKVN